MTAFEPCDDIVADIVRFESQGDCVYDVVADIVADLTMIWPP